MAVFRQDLLRFVKSQMGAGKNLREIDMKEKRAGLFNKLCLVMLVSCFLILGSISATAQTRVKVPKSKIGATHHTHSTGDFELDEKATTLEGSSSAPLVGFALFYERLFLDKFSAAFKYGYGLERSMETTIGTNELEILETASFWALEFRAFVKDNIRPGLKPFLGVAYGNYSVNTTITIIPTAGSETEEETSATIPYTMLSVGADYTFGFGGIRLEAGQTTGKRNDLEGSDTYRVTYNYDGSVVGISVYSFF